MSVTGSIQQCKRSVEIEAGPASIKANGGMNLISKILPFFAPSLLLLIIDFDKHMQEASHDEINALTYCQKLFRIHPGFLN